MGNGIPELTAEVGIRDVDCPASGETIKLGVNEAASASRSHWHLENESGPRVETGHR